MRHINAIQIFTVMLLACAVQAAPLPVTFTLEKAGNVSLAVYDAQGRQLRTLLNAVPYPAGRHSVSWDGLDRAGRPVLPGNYRWRLLRTDGLRSEYLMSAGTSIGAQWWPGNHGGPVCVAVAEDSFVTAAGTEGPPEIIRCTFDGEVIWYRGSFEPARNPSDVAIANGKVYYLQDNGKIHVLDFATGASIGKPLSALVPVGRESFPGLQSASTARQTFTFDLPNGDYFLRFHHGDATKATTRVEVNFNEMEPSPGHRALADKMAWWQIPAVAAGKAQPIFLPQIYGNPRAVSVRDGKLHIHCMPESAAGQPVYWRINEMEILALADRVAASGDQLVASSSGVSALMWLDPNTGEILDTAPMAGVKDVAIDTHGTLYALVGDTVVTLTRAQKTPVVLVRGLKSPVSIDVDATRGDLWVLEGGASQQVKHYTTAGVLAATLGRAGGRLTGAFQQRDFDGVSDIIADGHGGFLVAEKSSAPRRVARFDRNGNVVKNWFGGMGFYVHTSLDQLDPTVGWMRPQETRWVMKVQMDYQRRDWRPLASYRWDALLDERFFQRIPEYMHFRTLRRDLNGDGTAETLLWAQSSIPGLLWVEDEAARQLRPLAAMGMVDAELFDTRKPLPVEQLPEAWVGAIRLAGGDPTNVATRVRYARFSWADANGDGIMQAEELQLAPGPIMGARAVRIDDTLTLWQGGTLQHGIYTRYTPTRYTACGAPVWDITQPEIGPKMAGNGNLVALHFNARGDQYMLLDGGGDGTKSSGTYDTAVHGWAWPTTLLDGSAIMQLDHDGQVIWRSGEKAARWPHPRAQLMRPRNINGFARGCVAVGDQTEQPCEFWTEDGLYVGGLFDGRDGMDGSLPGGKPDPRYTWLGVKAKRIGVNNFYEHSLFAGDDMLMGGHVAQLADGSVVFLGHGGNNNPCYRITGWDDWDRLEGALIVAQPAVTAQGTGSGLQGTFFSTPDLNGAPALSHTGSIWFSWQKPWPDGAPTENFSARWEGVLEPRFSEEYTLSVYARGEFRLWVDGREVTWARQDYPRDREVKKGHTLPIALRAGQRVPIRLEYRATMSQPNLHLNWESLSQPVEHIPAAYLYGGR